MRHPRRSERICALSLAPFVAVLGVVLGAARPAATAAGALAKSGLAGQTVYDPVLGVTWLSDANLAIMAASKSALGSLYYTTLGLHEPDTAVPTADRESGPFHDFQPYQYWTDTVAVKKQQGYLTFSFDTGWPGTNIVKDTLYVLPMIVGNPLGTPVGSGKVGNGNGLYASADGMTVLTRARE